MMTRSITSRIIFLLPVMLLVGDSPGFAQDPFAISILKDAPKREMPFDIWMQPNTDHFNEIQRQADEYFQQHGQVKGYKHWKRWEYIMQHRLSPEGKLTNYAAQNLFAHRKYEKEHDDLTGRVFGGSWEQEASDDCLPEDPDNGTGIGRVNVIAFHPTSSTTIYAGTPAGGLWKTTNEGVTWESLSNGIPSLGVSGIAIHPTSPNTIYILTGDGDGGHTPSIGVLKTTNDGYTWQSTGYIPMDKGYKLVMKPGDPNTLFVAATTGLFRTQDAGGSWTLVLNENMRDIEFRPGTPDTMYACTYEEVFRSYDGGDTWIESSVPGLSLGAARCALAVTPADPNYVYCLAGPGGPTGFFKGLFRSTNNGVNYTTVTVSPNLLDGSVNGDQVCPGCSQVNWDLALAVDPNNRMKLSSVQ